MIILEKYIKAFLKEAASTAIANRAIDLTGKEQHQGAASYSNDMTEISNQEVLLKLLENVGSNCFISFVDKYDEKIPRLEVSPEVSYDTPHGNYAYPLTVKSLKDIVEKSSIGGANFALERPYFHMFKKSNSAQSVEIQPDGSNNYSGNYDKDLRTIVHTAFMFNAARNLEKNPMKYAASSDSDEQENRLIKFGQIRRRIKRKINANTRTSEMNNESFYRILNSLSEDLCYLVNLNDKKYPREVVELIVDFLVNTLKIKINSFQNKFFVRIKGKRKLLSKFHGLYYSCFMLAKGMPDNVDIFENDDANAFDVDKINNPKENRVRQGSIFTMLLNSIDIDFINDRGSKTLHPSEPIQAVYLNSSKKENVVLVGTFNNIFQTKYSRDYKKNEEPHDPVTMNKIVDILEKNPQLNDLFGTELFDDVKLDNQVEFDRKLAWADLTKKKLLIAKFIQFHSTNDIFNLNMYVGDDELIIFDIGLKENFVNLPINEKIISIKNNLKKMAKIEHRLDYIGVFLNKKMWKNKNLYTTHPYSAQSMYAICDEVYTEMENYLANLDDLSKKENQEKYITIKMFIEFLAQIIIFLQNLK